MSDRVDRTLSTWCTTHLGSPADSVLFRAGYLSEVVGVVLGSGAVAVVKIRPAAPRMSRCALVQTALFAAGFPVAELLVPAARYDEQRVASAEAFVERRCGTGTPEASARLLADQVRLVAPVAPAALAPPPASVRWHHDEPGLWPTPDDREVDLNARGIAAIDAAAAVAPRELLVSYDGERQRAVPLGVPGFDATVDPAAGAGGLGGRPVGPAVRREEGPARRPDQLAGRAAAG